MLKVIMNLNETVMLIELRVGETPGFGGLPPQMAISEMYLLMYVRLDDSSTQTVHSDLKTAIKSTTQGNPNLLIFTRKRFTTLVKRCSILVKLHYSANVSLSVSG